MKTRAKVKYAKDSQNNETNDKKKHSSASNERDNAIPGECWPEQSVIALLWTWLNRRESRDWIGKKRLSSVYTLYHLFGWRESVCNEETIYWEAVHW